MMWWYPWCQFCRQWWRFRESGLRLQFLIHSSSRCNQASIQICLWCHDEARPNSIIFLYNFVISWNSVHCRMHAYRGSVSHIVIFSQRSASLSHQTLKSACRQRGLTVRGNRLHLIEWLERLRGRNRGELSAQWVPFDSVSSRTCFYIGIGPRTRSGVIKHHHTPLSTSMQAPWRQLQGRVDVRVCGNVRGVPENFVLPVAHCVTRRLSAQLELGFALAVLSQSHAQQGSSQTFSVF